MKKAVYSGSFDPITKGHIDIIERASKMCDKLFVLVLNNANKKYMFNLDERVDMVAQTLNYLPNVEIISFDGLLVNFMKDRDIKFIFRGVRAVSDYEYELTIAYANYEISDDTIETLLIPARKQYLYLSSTVVRDVAINGGNLSLYLSEYVEKKVVDKLKKGV